MQVQKIPLLFLLFVVSCNPSNFLEKIAAQDGASLAPQVQYSSDEATARVGQAFSINPLVFSTVVPLTSCSIHPALPTGLTINPSTCTISGVPLSTSSLVSFQVKAINTFGETNANLLLRVEADDIVFHYQYPQTLELGEVVSVSPTLDLKGAHLISCSITPSLPAGLLFDHQNCTIRGAATEEKITQVYRVELTTNFGSAVAELTFGTVLSCPSGYVKVPRNPSVDALSDFCVAKYEMKNVNGFAASVPQGLPWVNLTQQQSIDECRRLGPAYDLISNPQWMAIARNIEQVDENWSSNTKGVGVLARGHSDGDPFNMLEAIVEANSAGAFPGVSPAMARAQNSTSSDLNDGYSWTNNNRNQPANSGWEQRRTHVLSTGAVIWDFSGNASEWVNWRLQSSLKAYSSFIGEESFGWVDWRLLDRWIGENSSDVMLPKTWASSFINFSVDFSTRYSTALNRNNGLGVYIRGGSSSGEAALRGGHFNLHSGAGVYGLDFTNHHSLATGTMFGFRCVYQP